MKQFVYLLLFVLAAPRVQALPDDSLLLGGGWVPLRITYDLGKATLRPESKDSLDQLVAFLQCHNGVKLQVAVHADSRASNAYCVKITQARAQSVCDYLISKGIAPARLMAIGYGETRPLKLPDGTVLTDKFIYSHPSKEEQEKYFAMNRRTELRIIALDYAAQQ